MTLKAIFKVISSSGYMFKINPWGIWKTRLWCWNQNRSGEFFWQCVGLIFGATETADGIFRTRRPRPNSSPEVMLGKKPLFCYLWERRAPVAHCLTAYSHMFSLHPFPVSKIGGNHSKPFLIFTSARKHTSHAAAERRQFNGTCLDFLWQKRRK